MALAVGAVRGNPQNQPMALAVGNTMALALGKHTQMTLLNLSWKNLSNKPLTMLLSLVLFALGVGLISFLLLVNHQINEKFEKNLAGIDLVIGAKGSPLQLILSSMYHIDAPTGNIPIKGVMPYLNPKNPFIKSAIPLSLGDSYRGYRIVGTTANFLELYQAKVRTGRSFKAIMEVLAGATAAQELGLKVGSTFQSSHGLIEDDNLVHEGHAFKVVGIMQPTGASIDQLLLTPAQSIWEVHEHAGMGAAPAVEETEEAEHEHEDEEHAAEDSIAENHAESTEQVNGIALTNQEQDHQNDDEAPHEQDEAHHLKSILEYPDKEITALLLQFNGHNITTLNLQRMINQNTSMQAATPAIEITRLYSLMGVGQDALRWLAFIIMGVSGLSIFISLFSSLRDRRYELALMRTMGASPGKLFAMIIMEGLLLAIFGYIIGLLISHGGMELLAGEMKAAYRYTFTGRTFLVEEGYLLLGALAVGFVAAVIPAIQARNTDISETLAEG
ncbi:ABC transporter permease [Haliscomenobacter sp.]|uniref:ABC transporter permease n=1 Tax=Haliscomenobacter sp. TaxID=2717303 RepID=UPI0035942A59